MPISPFFIETYGPPSSVNGRVIVIENWQKNFQLQLQLPSLENFPSQLQQNRVCCNCDRKFSKLGDSNNFSQLAWHCTSKSYPNVLLAHNDKSIGGHKFVNR